MGAIPQLPRLRSRPPRRRGKRDGSAPILLSLVLGAVCILAITANVEGASSATGVSARVIDGDTIEDMATGERIRLPNIDTPETGQRARCAAERTAGEQAKNAARALVSSGTVTVEPTGRVDAYGRTVGYVRVDGRDLGELLIARGLARPWRGGRQPWCGADGALLSIP